MSVPAVRFLHEPRTEQELVGIFVTLLEDIKELEKPIVIERLHEAFPDCTLRANDKCIRIEFELYAESYDHPFDGKTVVVCWKKGRERPWFKKIPQIIELEPLASGTKYAGRFVSIRNCDGPWDERTFFEIAESEDTSPGAIATMRQIIALATVKGFGPIWTQDPKPSFGVGLGDPYFRVWADGKFRLIVKRYLNSDVLPSLLADLNHAVPTLHSSPESVREKKRLFLAEHLSDPKVLERFFAVWERFQQTEAV